MDYVVLGIVAVNLFVTAYVAWRAPQVLAAPFVRALGEKEGELIVLRLAVQQAQAFIQQSQAAAGAAAGAEQAKAVEAAGKKKG